MNAVNEIRVSKAYSRMDYKSWDMPSEYKLLRPVSRHNIRAEIGNKDSGYTYPE